MSTTNPEHCPGVDSDQAGKASACEGCPNRSICSSNELQASKDIAEAECRDIALKLSSIKHILIVMSGKGGVGKSTLASLLARYIAQSDQKINVGLLDIDICGPSIPKTMGMENGEIFNSSSGWSPIYVEDNLAVMSCGFLLDSLDDAVIWRGPKKNGIIKQFLRDVDWGDLDYLIIDTPPGTSDEHLSLANYLKMCRNVRGTIMITTPQEIAQMDVRKQIEFCLKVKLPIIGFVENMSVFICPKCQHENYIFKRSKQSIEERFEIKMLGRIPIDQQIGKSCDEGQSPFSNQESNHKTKESFQQVWQNILKQIQQSN